MRLGKRGRLDSPAYLFASSNFATHKTITLRTLAYSFNIVSHELASTSQFPPPTRLCRGRE